MDIKNQLNEALNDTAKEQQPVYIVTNGIQNIGGTLHIYINKERAEVKTEEEPVK